MEGKPEHIRDAQLRGDAEALAAMGAKGGIRSGLLNVDRKSKQEKDLDSFMASQVKLYHVNDEGDVLPPDPHIIDALEQ